MWLRAHAFATAVVTMMTAIGESPAMHYRPPAWAEIVALVVVELFIAAMYVEVRTTDAWRRNQEARKRCG